MTMSDRALPRKNSQPGTPGGRPLIKRWIQDFLGGGGETRFRNLKLVSKEGM